LPRVENDFREINSRQWVEIRKIQGDLTGSSTKWLSSKEIAEAMELLMRECRRLRTLAEFELMRGFNEGYDNGYADAQHDAEILSEAPPF
jgi:hypothetical protein